MNIEKSKRIILELMKLVKREQEVTLVRDRGVGKGYRKLGALDANGGVVAVSRVVTPLASGLVSVRLQGTLTKWQVKVGGYRVGLRDIKSIKGGVVMVR